RGPRGGPRGGRAAVGEGRAPAAVAVRAGRGRTGRALRDQPGELTAHVVGERRADGREPPGLGLERRDEAGVLVAEVEVDELGREVEVAVAVLVPEPGALAARDGQRVDRGL